MTERSTSEAGSAATKSPLKRALNKIIALAREKTPPWRIALGMALGIFIGLLPIMGIQMAVVSMFAIPMRANLKAAIAGVWISNPITFIPMYYGCYRFGLLFVPSTKISWERFSGVMTDASAWNWSEVTESVMRLLAIGGEILVPLWTGSAILGTFFGVLTYIVTFRFVVNYRKRREARKRS